MSSLVMTEVLTWSQSLPNWQRDVLRQLVQNSNKIEDLNEIVDLILAENGIRVDGVRASIPFDSSHAGCGCDGLGGDVSLLKIDEIDNVNALRNGAEIGFSGSGMSVVFGENGSGKSSIARILKHSCRCNDSVKNVLPNVFSSKTGMGANIHYRVGDIERVVRWSGGTCSEELQAISVFDSKCAPVYVTEKNEVAYSPFGLRVLAELAKTCDGVKAIIEEKERLVVADPPNVPKEFEGTAVAVAIGKVTHKTSRDDILRLAKVEDSDVARLAWIAKALSENDPVARLKELDARRTRLTEFRERLVSFASEVNEEALDFYKQCLSDYAIACESARITQERAFSDAPLVGVGSEVWRILWGAARNYFREKAFPECEFPVGVGVGRCVLCQQDISDETRLRLQAFEEYVQGEAVKKVQSAKEVLSNVSKSMQNVLAFVAYAESVSSELFHDCEDEIGLILRGLKRVSSGVLSNVESLGWGNIAGYNVDSCSVVEGRISAIDVEIFAMKQVIDPVERGKIIAESVEIRSRAWLCEVVDAIMRYVNVLSWIDKIGKCKAATSTVKITKKGKQLTELFVTEELQSCFSKWLGVFFANNSLVQLEKVGGDKGVLYFKVKLKDAVIPARIADVVSEGEFKAIALAAFLAEIELSPHKSAIVLDDPVSSFDHKRRELVAEILSEVASSRQVIVFTHDIYFLTYLNKSFKACQNMVVSGHGKSYGYLSDGSPVESLPFKKRCGLIKDKLQRAKAFLNKGNVVEYEPIAWDISRSLRLATERCVEEILFCGVVTRFDRSIHTQQLHKRITTIEWSDVSMLIKLMDAHSKNVHDQPCEAAVAVPDIDLLNHDFESLVKWSHDYLGRV